MMKVPILVLVLLFQGALSSSVPPRRTSLPRLAGGDEFEPLRPYNQYPAKAEFFVALHESALGRKRTLRQIHKFKLSATFLSKF